MIHDLDCPSLDGKSKCTCPPPPAGSVKPTLYAPIQVPDWQVPILAGTPFGRLRVVTREELAEKYK